MAINKMHTYRQKNTFQILMQQRDATLFVIGWNSNSQTVKYKCTLDLFLVCLHAIKGDIHVFMVTLEYK